jgi:exopolysaccharide production repressor protein
MSFPLFLRGMLLLLVIFAITTYVMTQSFWTTAVYTMLCALLVQAGYFLGILLMVWRSHAGESNETAAPKAEANQPSPSVGEPPGASGSMPETPRSGQL